MALEEQRNNAVENYWLIFGLLEWVGCDGGQRGGGYRGCGDASGERNGIGNDYGVLNQRASQAL